MSCIFKDVFSKTPSSALNVFTNYFDGNIRKNDENAMKPTRF